MVFIQNICGCLGQGAYAETLKQLTAEQRAPIVETDPATAASQSEFWWKLDAERQRLLSVHHFAGKSVCVRLPKKRNGRSGEI